MKKICVWEVSLQVTSPSRLSLKHQLQFEVQAETSGTAVALAAARAQKDGHTVVSHVSTRKNKASSFVTTGAETGVVGTKEAS